MLHYIYKPCIQNAVYVKALNVFRVLRWTDLIREV